MQRWISFGASARGSAHIASGKPNQDSWAAFHHAACDVIVVSDGMGSKDFSAFGSAAACRAVDYAICSSLAQNAPLNLEDQNARDLFFNRIKDAWLQDIAPLSAREACATCLFGARVQETVWIGMLGDGCAAGALTNGASKLLQDNKDASFSNITASLSENVAPSDWQLIQMPAKECRGIVLCTDGVADDLTDTQAFASAYIESVVHTPAISAAKEAFDMLIDWPTPKHSDDKTIACLIRRDYADE